MAEEEVIAVLNARGLRVCSGFDFYPFCLRLSSPFPGLPVSAWPMTYLCPVFLQLSWFFPCILLYEWRWLLLGG